MDRKKDKGMMKMEMRKREVKRRMSIWMNKKIDAKMIELIIMIFARFEDKIDERFLRET